MGEVNSDPVLGVLDVAASSAAFLSSSAFLSVELGLSRHQSASEPNRKPAWSVLKFTPCPAIKFAGFSTLRSTLSVSIPVLLLDSQLETFFPLGGCSVGISSSTKNSG